MEPREVKVGEIVLYKVTASDAKNYAEQISKAGFYANTHDEGQVVPLVVSKIWSPNYINGQCLMDGPGTLWVTSVQLGDQPGQFSFAD